MRISKRPVDRRPVDFWASVNRCCFPNIPVGYEKSADFRSTCVDRRVYTLGQTYQAVPHLLTVLTGLLRNILDLYIYNYLKSLESIDSLSRTFEQKRIKSQQDVFCSSSSKASASINRSTGRSTPVNRCCNRPESLRRPVNLCQNRICTHHANNANDERSLP
jgi:hypothetical protein